MNNWELPKIQQVLNKSKLQVFVEFPEKENTHQIIHCHQISSPHHDAFH